MLFHGNARTRIFTVGMVGSIALFTVLFIGPLWAHPSEAAAPPLTDIEFTVGESAPGIGAAGSGVAAEAAIEAGGGDPAPGQTEDDVYLQNYPGAPTFPLTNVKIYDDGGATVGAPPIPPLDLTIRTAGDISDVDAWSIMNTNGQQASPPIELQLGLPANIAGMYVQFSVDPSAIGVAGPFPPDVFTEAALGEAMGDVFETGAIAPGGGGVNTLISDEGAHGLVIGDDLCGLIANDTSTALPPLIDTDGDASSLPDMPYVYFSFNAMAPMPATVASGADICLPGTAPGVGTPAIDPLVVIPAASLGLVGGDDVDALWMDQFAHVIFSLKPGSPSLATMNNPITAVPGCQPGDLIHVALSFNPIPGSTPGPPALGPAVCALATDLGLAATDNVNALWITAYSLEGLLVPVELSVFTAD